MECELGASGMLVGLRSVFFSSFLRGTFVQPPSVLSSGCAVHWQGLVSLFCENLRPLLLARFLPSIEFRFRLKQAKLGIGGGRSHSDSRWGQPKSGGSHSDSHSDSRRINHRNTVKENLLLSEPGAPEPQDPKLR